MSSPSEPKPFDGDRPIADLDHDRLGFGAAAGHIAEAIVRLASPEGFVIGIEGEWGSGKSSFVNLIIDSLKSSRATPEIIQFLPWLISSRSALLRELFTEVTKASIRIDLVLGEQESTKGFFWKLWPKRYSERELRRQRLQGLFERFSSRLGAVGKLAEIAAASGVPGVGIAGLAVSQGAQAVGNLTAAKSLEDDKELIRAELSKLTRKIVIFVDDLDRLEPGEASEVLRLVRAVADFPNIVYVLCYSREILAQNLSTALRIGKGEEYIEKIVQATFSIPQPEAFDLRRMFRTDLQELYAGTLADESPRIRQVRERLAGVIDVEGGRTLRTPRHVVRAINSLRFYATPVLGKIDLADMVWLQLIRVRSMALYRWIESYMTGVAAVIGGAGISDEGKKAELRDILSIFDGADQSPAHTHDDRLVWLGEFLPGIRRGSWGKQGGPDEWKLYDQLTAEGVAEFIADRRIGSPHHYRYYFALSDPVGVLSDGEFGSFVAKSAESPDEAAKVFAEMAVKARPQGGVVAEALLDRLDGEGIERIPVQAVPGVLMAIAHGIDTAAMAIGEGEWGKYWIWIDASRILRRAFPRITQMNRQVLTQLMFGEGKSLGWLTDVFRGEVFDHGVYGDRAKPERDRLLTTDEFRMAGGALLARYRELDIDDLLHLPQMASVLYAWLQYSPDSKGEVRSKVAEWVRSDANFVAFLERLRSWRATNGRVNYPLKRAEVELILDFKEAEARLKGLAEDAKGALAERAAALLEAIQSGDEY